MLSTRMVSLLLANVALTVLAQSLLRAGMRSDGGAARSFVATALQAATDMRVVAGMATFGASLGIWLWMLSRVRISVLYPLQQGLVFIALQFVAWKWLGEGWSATRLVGVAVVALGVVLLARG